MKFIFWLWSRFYGLRLLFWSNAFVEIVYGLRKVYNFLKLHCFEKLKGQGKYGYTLPVFVSDQTFDGILHETTRTVVSTKSDSIEVRL